jgi:hypothetical protein
MTNKNTGKQEQPKAESAKINHEHSATEETNNPAIEREVKSSAGEVQEELTPQRRSAGHSHTH